MATFVPCFDRCRTKLSIIDIYVSTKSAMTTFVFNTGAQRRVLTLSQTKVRIAVGVCTQFRLTS